MGPVCMRPNLWIFTFAACSSSSLIVLRQFRILLFDLDYVTYLTYPNYPEYLKGSKSGSETRTCLGSVSNALPGSLLDSKTFNRYSCPLPMFICYHALCFLNLLFVVHQQIYGYSDH
jgi:hypothetical protein